MVTDNDGDERREAAERLRAGGIARNVREAYVLLLHCVGIRPQLPADKTYQEALSRIADLIDPTCRIVYVDESYSTPDVGRVDEWHYECSRCCYELSDGEMYEFESGALPFLYCPECGCRVTGGERR